MKKTFALILTVAMLALSLVSCGAPKDDFVYRDSDLVTDGYITLGEYKGLYINPVEVTEDEVNAYVVEHVGHEEEEIATVERAAADGDVVNINYVGKIDGVEFEGGSAEDQDVLLGSGSMIEGFEDGIVGINVGETKTINVTFPEDYHNEELSGKAATFDITLNAVYDESVFEAAEQELLLEKMEAYTADADAVTADLVWEQIMENATVNKYPAGVVDSLAKALADNQIATYYSWGLTDLSMLGMSEESIREMMVPEAETMIKEELVIYAIAQAEGMTITDAEFDAKLALLAQASSSADVVVTPEEYLKHFTRQSVETKIYYDKVIALASSTVVDTPAE